MIGRYNQHEVAFEGHTQIHDKVTLHQKLEL